MEITYKGKQITLTPDEIWVLFYRMAGVSDDIRSSGEMDNRVEAAESLENKFEDLDHTSSSTFVIGTWVDPAGGTHDDNEFGHEAYE